MGASVVLLGYCVVAGAKCNWYLSILIYSLYWKKRWLGNFTVRPAYQPSPSGSNHRPDSLMRDPAVDRGRSTAVVNLEGWEGIYERSQPSVPVDSIHRQKFMPCRGRRGSNTIITPAIVRGIELDAISGKKSWDRGGRRDKASYAMLRD
jgi:hypothetical protein